MSAPPSWARLFLPFAAGYFLSYLFRTVNVIVGPVLSQELSLGAADLGLLTSTYFIAFGAAQLPLGVLLDRFGPRRVEAALLLIAAAGAAVFAGAQDIAMLAIGRGMLGLGVSACLMAAFKSFSQAFPPDRQASLTGWIMTSGTLGALMASAPLDLALRVASWRAIFLVLALITVVTAAGLFLCVPDGTGARRRETAGELLAGIRHVLTSRHFWRYAPLAFMQIGGFMAVQALWSSAWMIHVNGFSRSLAAGHIAAMSAAMVVAYFLIGLLSTALARRGFGAASLLGVGMSLALVSLGLIVTRSVEWHYLLWVAYGVFSSTGTLSYPLTASGFPVNLSGRANTILNLLAFAGAFSVQWGMGVAIDALLTRGYAEEIAYRNSFAVLLVMQTLSLLWFLSAGRRLRR